MATATGILPFSGGVSLLPDVEAKVFASADRFCECRFPASTDETRTTPIAVEFIIKSLLFIKPFSLLRFVRSVLFNAEQVMLAANDEHIFRDCRGRHQPFPQRIARQ